MLDRLPQLGPHEAQIALTVTLLVAIAVLALLCDLLRYRNWSQAAAAPLGATKPALRTAVGTTLVPEEALVVPAASGASVKKPSRASRLAAALKQPRRTLSPGAQAAIARGAHAVAVHDAKIQYAHPAMPSATVLPAGFQKHSVLAELTAGRFQVSGLVVGITVTGYEGTEQATEAFRGTIATLIEPGEFAAPLNGHDFILLLPGLKGGQAQRRMREMSQQLWALQTDSLTQHGTSFQWGGVEVHGEELAEAVESALDRMRESRGARKGPAAAQHTEALQRAV